METFSSLSAMTCIEVKDIGKTFPPISVQAALEHHSVGIEFESDTEVKDIKKQPL